ncbi:MAG TPA: ABC transporter substrate-binding protein [Microvirga sp.]|jgi:peptide/nickel transport system substrate-binding protein
MRPPITIAQARVILDDPHACTDSGDVLAVFGAIFDPLVRRGSDGSYEPALAEAWTMDADARTTTFRLRPGVTFHDGEPCDSKAVRFCLERMARPDMGATLGAPGVYSQYLAGMTVETPDALTVRMTTVEPIADILDIIAYGHIVSPRSLANAGDDLAKRAVGTGPYILERYTAGESLEVRANADHFDGPPAYAGIRWRQVANPDERLEALNTGQVQVANGLGLGAVDATAGRANLTVVRYLAPTALIYMFNAASGPAKDPRVRLALNLAVDRDALVADVLNGAGQALWGFVSPAHYGADPDAPPTPRDLDRARQLLTEAGYADGLSLNVYCPTRLPDEAEALTAALADQLEPLGVRFTVHLESDRTHYANQVRLKNIHDLCVFDSSPMSVFRVLQEKIDSRMKGSWWEGYRNPDVEALIDAARRMTDRSLREAMYRQCYRMLQADPPWIYLYNHHRVIGIVGDHPEWLMRGDGILDVRRLPAIEAQPIS